MPLCNGVRPWHEDMPRKDNSGHVELYTSKTTEPILSILNRVTSEPEVARDNLENSLMRNGVLTAYGRKHLLNAVYGKEPDPNDYYDKRIGFTGKSADQDRFYRQHLGNKLLRGWVPGKIVKKGAGIHYENEGDLRAYEYGDVEEEDGKTVHVGQGPRTGKEPTPAWMGAELKRVGAFDPTSPDKRGKWKMVPMQGIELKDGQMPVVGAFSPPYSPIKGASNRSNLRNAEEAPKSMRIDQMMLDLRIRPAHALTVIKEILRAVFQAATVHIDKFQLSLGELVGLARHGEAFHVPYHTEQEQTFIKALRLLCAKHLDLLLKSQTRQDFDGIASFPTWKKDNWKLMERVMQSMPAWQLNAVQTFWNLNRKMVVLRDEIDTKGRRVRAGVFGKKPGDVPAYNAYNEAPLNANTDYIHLQQEVRRNKLDVEWYERLLIIHKRDRQYRRAELEMQFEHALLPKKSDPVPSELDVGSKHFQIAKSDDTAKQTTHTGQPLQLPSNANGTPQDQQDASKSSAAAMAIEATPAAALEERKPRPLEGITHAELLDMPQYWYEDRIASGDGGIEDKLTIKASKALKAMMFDTEEFILESGKKRDHVMTSKMLAYKTLHRKRGNMSANNPLSFVSLVQRSAGVVPGRIVDDDALIGASRGACGYRLIPSFEQHDKKSTQHPTRRPPSAKIKNMAQFLEIQKVLKHPSVDGKGKPLRLAPPVGFHRPPTATPRTHRFRVQSFRRASAHSTHEHIASPHSTDIHEPASATHCTELGGSVGSRSPVFDSSSSSTSSAAESEGSSTAYSPQRSSPRPHPASPSIHKAAIGIRL